MATNKKRKLNTLADPRNISAFAARKQLQVAHDAHESNSDITFRTHELPVNTEEQPLFNTNSILSSGFPNQKIERGTGQEFDQSREDDGAVAADISDSDADDERLIEVAISGRSRQTRQLHPSDRSRTNLTTVNLSKDNVERLRDGALRISIGPGERLVVLGEYGISVVEGQITILGAILSASPTIHDVCASSSHSLPVIRFFSSDTEKSEIYLHQSKSRLRSLMELSPLFAKLWSLPSSDLGASDKTELEPWRSKDSSFQILLTRDEDPRMGYNPTVSPPEWNELLSVCASEKSKDDKASVTMVCGPKSSGKSTFSKLLINRLLTRFPAQTTDHFVAFLDLDPGQPEFSPPGQLSLILLSKPNFGPPFSHPDVSKCGTRLIRAHSISAVSPSSDPEFYMACATNLFSCYLNLLCPVQYPLVINTPGWILGTGLELLTNLIKEARPTRVVYMSQDGPREVVESLQAALRSTPVLKLPSQPTENLSRTSAHLRAMQYMSYFHLDPASPENCVWKSNPITSTAPLEVKYAGKAAGILGMMCFGEQPPDRMLRETIDGSLVAVVVVEDVDTIFSSNENKKMEGKIPVTSEEELSMPLGNSYEGLVKLPFTRRLENPHVLQTSEGIPFLTSSNVFPLDPSCSSTIGLALVRGIDIRRQRLQLLTPIPLRSIIDIRASGKEIILVSGKLDIPGWAYLEALYKKEADAKEDVGRRHTDDETQDGRDKDGDYEAIDGQLDCGDGFEDAPWVEILRGDKGREVGARVWRVRRDLGKTSGGD